MEIGSSSREGMIRAQDQMDRASASLVNKTVQQDRDSDQDITKEILDQNEAKNNYTMNVRMAKVQDNMVGTLLDIVG